MRLKVAADLWFSSNHTAGGDFVFDCSRHCIDNVLLERCLVRREPQTREAVAQFHNGHRG